VNCLPINWFNMLNHLLRWFMQIKILGEFKGWIGPWIQPWIITWIPMNPYVWLSLIVAVNYLNSMVIQVSDLITIQTTIQQPKTQCELPKFLNHWTASRGSSMIHGTIQQQAIQHDSPAYLFCLAKIPIELHETNGFCQLRYYGS